MTGAIPKFFADLIETWRRENPYIDLCTLPAQITEPIQPWVDAYLSASGFERRFEICSVQFAIKRGPLIKASKLTAVFSRFTELAAAAAETFRQETAKIEAESGFAVAKGRAKTLTGRLSRAIEAEVKTAGLLKAAQEEVVDLKRQV